MLVSSHKRTLHGGVTMSMAQLGCMYCISTLKGPVK